MGLNRLQYCIPIGHDLQPSKAGWPTGLGPHEGELMTLDTVIGGCVRYYSGKTALIASEPRF